MKQKFQDGWCLFTYPYIVFYKFIRDMYLEIKWFIQRGKRGYADCDVWDFDSYLSDVIVKGLIELKENVHGVPCRFASKDGKYVDLEAWKSTIQKMINTFHTAQLINKGTYLYLPTYKNKLSDYINLKEEKFNIITMSYEDCKRYEDGWQLFQKYFFNLWD